jgi:hypothetical protein
MSGCPPGQPQALLGDAATYNVAAFGERVFLHDALLVEQHRQRLLLDVRAMRQKVQDRR